MTAYAIPVVEPSATEGGILRIATIGSVDDGKSTLIGRLLHDSRQLLDDQVSALATASRRRGAAALDLSFATDGLRDERDQGITIDVAYRYASTPRRKLVIADCPGHVQYTRNMATGASSADLAVSVVDVTAGLRDQTRRHCCVAALLGVRSMIVAANKMDLVGWDRDAYEAVAAEMRALAARTGMDAVMVIPVSALNGDNVVERSESSPWYEGPTLFEAIDAAPAVAWANGGSEGSRLPVQWVLRGPGKGRAYAGMVSGGTIGSGDEVVILPSGLRSTVSSVSTHDGPLGRAHPPLSVSVTLADDVDAGRGDMIASSASPPEVLGTLDATICWFSAEPIRPGNRYRVKHTTRVLPARVEGLEGRMDLKSLQLSAAGELRENDIGRARLVLGGQIAADAYRSNRLTGSFVLVDEVTNATLGAGLVELDGRTVDRSGL